MVRAVAAPAGAWIWPSKISEMMPSAWGEADAARRERRSGSRRLIEYIFMTLALVDFFSKGVCEEVRWVVNCSFRTIDRLIVRSRESIGVVCEMGFQNVALVQRKQSL